MPSITVHPIRALVDEKVNIRIDGLETRQKITVYAHLTSENGSLFESFAHYVANYSGVVDFCGDESVSGSYVGVEPMGLFWSMQPSSVNSRKHSRLSKQDVCKPFVITICVFDSFISTAETRTSDQLVSIDVERWYKADGVRRVPVREGRLRGTLFIPRGNGPFPGVIDLFGTAGGLTEFRGSLLASRGIAALSLAFFAFEDLPDTAFDIDLEYFEEAKEFLENHPLISGRGIGMVGVSTGANIAIAAATYIPGIICAVAINGAIFASYSTFHYKCRVRKSVPADMNKMCVEHNGVVFGDCWRTENECEIGGARFEFQKSTSSFLFIFSGDDKAMDTDGMRKLVHRTADSGGRFRYRVITYEGAGHLLEPPYSPHSLITHTKLINLPQLWGGNAKQHATAQELSWREIVKFLHKELKPISNL